MIRMVFQMFSSYLLLTVLLKDFVKTNGQLIGRVCFDELSRRYECCHHFINIVGNCTECPLGFTSNDGIHCYPCAVGFYGKRCSIQCRCPINECHHKIGCFEDTTGLNGNIRDGSNKGDDLINPIVFYVVIGVVFAVSFIIILIGNSIRRKCVKQRSHAKCKNDIENDTTMTEGCNETDKSSVNENIVEIFEVQTPENRPYSAKTQSYISTGYLNPYQPINNNLDNRHDYSSCINSNRSIGFDNKYNYRRYPFPKTNGQQLYSSVSKTPNIILSIKAPKMCDDNYLTACYKSIEITEEENMDSSNC